MRQVIIARDLQQQIRGIFGTFLRGMAVRSPLDEINLHKQWQSDHETKKRLLTQAIEALFKWIRKVLALRAGLLRPSAPREQPLARIFFNRAKVDLRNLP